MNISTINNPNHDFCCCFTFSNHFMNPKLFSKLKEVPKCDFAIKNACNSFSLNDLIYCSW